MSDQKPRRRYDPNAGTGWFEWFKMPENSTEIAYVHENGEVFDPVRGWNPPEFTIAAAEGRVFRLVRAVDVAADVEIRRHPAVKQEGAD